MAMGVRVEEALVARVAEDTPVLVSITGVLP